MTENTKFVLTAILQKRISDDTLSRVISFVEDEVSEASASSYRAGWRDCKAVAEDLLRRKLHENPDDQPEE